MRVVGLYSFKGGREIIETHYSALLAEVYAIIAQVDSEIHKTKVSQERGMEGRLLYSPKALNREFKKHFSVQGWHSYRVTCEYSRDFYTSDYEPPTTSGAFREMDFIKDRVGVEVQFGKYSFMVYNVCAK